MICLFLAVPGFASAQSTSYFDRDNNVSVLDRPRPDYQAQGVNLGTFQLFPSVTGSESYNDNIFALPSGTSDWITSISPNIDLKSNWPRNSVELTAGADANFYAGHGGQNTTDYQASLLGQIDTTYQSNFSASFGYGHLSLPRTSEVTIKNSLAPVEYDSITANVGGVQTLNRLRFNESVSFVRTEYGNGTDVNGVPLLLDQQNNNQTTVSGRANWALGPRIALYAVGNYNFRQYDEKPPVSPLNRDSHGYDVSIGSDFDITHLVRGQMQIGYLSQEYQSQQFHNVSGPTFHGNIEYFLSGLTTITARFDRSIVDAIDPVAVSFLQTQGSLEVDHELLRNVILSGRVAYSTFDFTGVQRNDQQFAASARATYLLNRIVGLTAAYSFINLDSSGAARIGNYGQNVISLSVVLQR